MLVGQSMYEVDYKLSQIHMPILAFFIIFLVDIFKVF